MDKKDELLCSQCEEKIEGSYWLVDGEIVYCWDCLDLYGSDLDATLIDEREQKEK